MNCLWLTAFLVGVLALILGQLRVYKGAKELLGEEKCKLTRKSQKIWDNLPNLEQLATDESGGHIIDVWVVEERLAVIKALVEAVNSETPCLHSDGGRNLLWGIALQTLWQFETGRSLAVDVKDHMPASAWWSTMNYYLVVYPLLAARNSGVLNRSQSSLTASIVETVRYLPNFVVKTRPDYCGTGNYSATDCMHSYKTLKAWEIYFEAVSLAEEQCRKLNGQDAKEVENLYDDVAGKLWDAHTESIREALYSKGPRQSIGNLTGEERDFVLGWSALVEFFGEARLRTDLYVTSSMETILPPQMLPIENENMSFETKVGVKTLSLLKVLTDNTGDNLLNFWKWGLRGNPKARDEARNLLINFSFHPSSVLPNFVVLLAKMLFP